MKHYLYLHRRKPGGRQAGLTTERDLGVDIISTGSQVNDWLPLTQKLASSPCVISGTMLNPSKPMRHLN